MYFKIFFKIRITNLWAHIQPKGVGNSKGVDMFEEDGRYTITILAFHLLYTPPTCGVKTSNLNVLFILELVFLGLFIEYS